MGCLPQAIHANDTGILSMGKDKLPPFLGSAQVEADA